MESENQEFRFPHAIDWNLISESISYYSQLGYKYIEVPWTVSKRAMNVTFKDSDGGVVGSAEQSFIEMMLDGSIKPGNYVACTPCFRKEEFYNEIKYPYFIKVELIRIGSDDVKECLSDAILFLGYRAPNIAVEETEDGFDLILNGIEIGSYGRREAFGFTWVYGTGLAEPRFSVAVNK